MSFAETPDGITELSTLAGGFISRKLLQLVVFSCVSSLGYYILFNSLHVIRVISKRHKKNPADSSLFFFKKSHGTTKISSHTHTHTHSLMLSVVVRVGEFLHLVPQSGGFM